MESENPADKSNPPITADAEANHHRDEANPKVPPAVIVSNPPPPPPKQDEITVNIKRDSIDWRTLRLEGFGLFVLIVYTIFTGLMYCANRDAANAAQSAAETAKKTLIATTNASHLEQRAWLAITPSAPLLPKLEVGKIGGSVKASVRIENTGKTPVQMLHGRMRLEVIPADTPKFSQHYRIPHFDYSNPSVGIVGATTVGTPILQPTGAVTVSLFDTLSQTDMLDYWPYRIAIYGELRYCDVFSEQHWVNFCFQYRGADETTPGDLSQYTACENVPPDKNGMDDLALHEKCNR